MRSVWLSSRSWSYGPVVRAEGFVERLRGLRMLDPGSALLLETSSVHAIGLSRPFNAVALNDEHLVIDVREVRPGDLVRFKGCRFVVELPIDVDPPHMGTHLEVTDV